jgi:catechol 2,3-dioxygenase-like lactoylglutathione lyase family enzyme
MTLRRVNHIAFLTRDLERLCRFYEELFEARTVVELPIPPPEGPGRHALISAWAAPRNHACSWLHRSRRTTRSSSRGLEARIHST